VFEEDVLQQVEPPFLSNAPLTTWVAYLIDIVARSARECHSLQPSVVQLLNDNNVLVVNCTDDNTTCIKPLWVMMDFGAQPIMIRKRLAQELGLTTIDLEPCLVTIVTSVGGTKHATHYIKQPL